MLQVGFSQAPGALLRFGFGHPASSDVLEVACPRLAGAQAPESWFGDAARLRIRTVEIDEHEGDVQAAAETAYRQLLQQVRGSSHPYLIRIWNYLDAINEGDGDGERYRRFCLGRATAVDAEFNQAPPAATAIGHAHRIGKVQLIALCAQQPGVALENPRQMPAWRYPRDYGPVSPGFSRGALLGDGRHTLLLASGTASIVGHRSLHVGDVVAQLRESLANLHALLDEAGTRDPALRFSLTQPQALRVYLRDPADLARVQAEVQAAGIAAAQVVYLHGDICRSDLLVELEGAFAPL